jgi:amino acid transporter
MFGYVAGDMLGTPRALYAFGRDRALPPVLARVHPRFHTPVVAIVTYAVVAWVVAASSTFERLAILSNVVTLLMYLLCVAASFELQRRDVRADGRPFSAPGGPVIPILAGLGIIWLLAQATRREAAITTAFLAVTSLYYLARGLSMRRRVIRPS